MEIDWSYEDAANRYRAGSFANSEGREAIYVGAERMSDRGHRRPGHDVFTPRQPGRPAPFRVFLMPSQARLVGSFHPPL